MSEKPVRIFRRKSDIPGGTRTIDVFENSLAELFFIEHPHVRKDSPDARELLHKFISKNRTGSVWAFYPWRGLAVRIPEERIYYRLRTARNRNLITEKEQLSYRKLSVGIAGLSVGSAAAAALASTGGPKHMKLADFDTIEITNLNRIRAGLPDINSNKAVVAARGVWELDPFANIEVWSEGLARETLSKFLVGKPRLDIFIDEMDSIDLKIAARVLCKKYRIPVLMATDNGDGAIFDVERYDLQTNLPIFNGRIATPRKGQTIDKKDFIRLAAQIIDPLYMTTRQHSSLLEIGKTLSGVAQLGTAASIAGAGLAFLVRQMAGRENLPSGRYVIACEESCIPGYNDVPARKERKAHAKSFSAAIRGKSR